jgi:hypothetical protein
MVEITLQPEKKRLSIPTEYIAHFMEPGKMIATYPGKTGDLEC